LPFNNWPKGPAQTIQLSAGNYRASLLPDLGGRLASLCYLSDAGAIDLVVPLQTTGFDRTDWPKAGAFPMVPFANRLPAKTVKIGQKDIQLSALPTAYPQHGWGHQTAWRVIEKGASTATLEWVHHVGPWGWPWAFKATLLMALEVTGLTVRLSVCNLDNQHPMPATFGWHPYHPMDAGFSLPVCAKAVWGLDTTGCASILLSKNPTEVGLSSPNTIALERWNGGAWFPLTKEWMLGVDVTGARHAVLHRPAQERYICVEPTMVLPGALAQGENIPLIPAGETVFLSWTCGLHASSTSTGHNTSITAKSA
jgi:aldose 1-epimerase